MRLNQRDRQIIKAAVRDTLGGEADVRLFGSRLDDQAKGGDIDLYIHGPFRDAHEAVRAETALWAALQKRLGEQRIDLLMDYPDKARRSLIYQVAREQGVRL